MTRAHTVQVRHDDASLDAAKTLAARLSRVLGVRVSRPEAYRIGAVLALGASDAALRAAAAGGAQRVDEDTPEEAARILRDGGYPRACVFGGSLVDYTEAGDLAIGKVGAFSPGNMLGSFDREHMSWTEAAREVLRRWPPTVTP